MKKTTLQEDVKRMNELAGLMPKTINEAIEFEETDNSMDFEQEPEMEEEQPMEEPEQEQAQVEQEPQHTGLDVASFVDDIRKKSLKGMAELADNPESEEYQLLKKIWQICDKKPENPMQSTQKTL